MTTGPAKSPSKCCCVNWAGFKVCACIRCHPWTFYVVSVSSYRCLQTPTVQLHCPFIYLKRSKAIRKEVVHWYDQYISTNVWPKTTSQNLLQLGVYLWSLKSWIDCIMQAHRWLGKNTRFLSSIMSWFILIKPIDMIVLLSLKLIHPFFICLRIFYTVLRLGWSFCYQTGHKDINDWR